MDDFATIAAILLMIISGAAALMEKVLKSAGKTAAAKKAKEIREIFSDDDDADDFDDEDEPAAPAQTLTQTPTPTPAPQPTRQITNHPGGWQRPLIARPTPSEAPADRPTLSQTATIPWAAYPSSTAPAPSATAIGQSLSPSASTVKSSVGESKVTSSVAKKKVQKPAAQVGDSSDGSVLERVKKNKKDLVVYSEIFNRKY